MSKRLIVNLLVLLGIVAIAVVIYIQLGKNKVVMAENSALSQKVNDQIPVTSAEVSQIEFSNNFSVDGSFAPSQKTMVIANMPGIVTKLNIKDGSYVTKGSILAVLDNDLLKNQVKSIEANISKMKKDLERYNILAQNGGIAQQQIDEVTNGILQYEIQLASTKKQISDTYLKAPISGVISSKKIEQGGYLAPGAQVAEIININPLKFQTYLTESEVFKIKQGQQVEISTNLHSGKDYNGTITLIDVEASPTKTFLVEITTPNSNTHPLKAGVNGKVRFSSVGSTNGLAVPKRAIVGSYTNASVYLIDNGRAVLTPVTIGKTNESFVQIVSGLSQGQSVVTSGQINLKDGTKVEVMKDLAKAN
jgi:membrane fusion protein, multidrug efflux system